MYKLVRKLQIGIEKLVGKVSINLLRHTVSYAPAVAFAHSYNSANSFLARWLATRFLTIHTMTLTANITFTKIATFCFLNTLLCRSHTHYTLSYGHATPTFHTKVLFVVTNSSIIEMHVATATYSNQLRIKLMDDLF